MKYPIFHEFGASTIFKEKFSNHFEYLNKLKLLATFDVNLTSFLVGVKDCV